MKYSWENPNWPHYTFDIRAIGDTLYQYALEAGKLSGGVSQLKDNLQYEAYLDLMVSEAINSSEIEGQHLNKEDVRSSIKNYLGINKSHERVSDPRAEGIAALMVDVRKSFNDTLSKETLFNWHSLVMQKNNSTYLLRHIEVGKWRTSDTPMQVVSGPIGFEKVHYEAPPSSRVPDEMERFITWYNNSNPQDPESELKYPGPVRSAIAHLWFETIHPFDDGNGRIGRALAEHALSQDLGRPPLLSLSSVIEKDKREYYSQLHKASKFDLDVSSWVKWFSLSVLKAQKDATLNVDYVLRKSQFWDKHQDSELNERQLKVIGKVFNAGEEGFPFGVSAKKYMGMANCSKATATRDLSDLLKKGCIHRLEGGGRNARYALSLTQPRVELRENKPCIEGIRERLSSVSTTKHPPPKPKTPGMR